MPKAIASAFRFSSCLKHGGGGGGGGGNSPIKMTGVLVIPFRGYNWSIGTA